MSSRGICAVLCIQAEPPPALLDALRSRSLDVRQCSHPFDAMTEMVLHERALSSPNGYSPMILVLVEPESIADARELAQAAALFAPHVGLWQFRAGERSQLSAFVPEEPRGRREGEAGEGPTMEIKVAPGATPTAAPKQSAAALVGRATHPPLRLARGRDDAPVQGLAADAPLDIGLDDEDATDPSIHAALSQEELAMLLAQDGGQD